MDISIITTDRSIVDSALHVCFAPSSVKQLLVVTSASRLLKLDAQNGVLLSEVCKSPDSELTTVCLSFVTLCALFFSY